MRLKLLFKAFLGLLLLGNVYNVKPMKLALGTIAGASSAVGIFLVGKYCLKQYRLRDCSCELERVARLIQYGYEIEMDNAKKIRDINQVVKSFDRKTLLSIACLHGHFNAVKELLKCQDIDVNKKIFGCYYTPLHYACEGERLEIVKELLKHPDIDVNKDIPLHCACERGHLEIVKELLKHPEIDVHKAYLHTPLCSACKKGHLDIVKGLLKCSKIDVNNSNLSPLYTAYIYNNKGLVVKELLKHAKININQISSEPDKKLACMANNNSPNVINALIDEYENKKDKGEIKKDMNIERFIRKRLIETMKKLKESIEQPEMLDLEERSKFVKSRNDILDKNSMLEIKFPDGKKMSIFRSLLSQK